MCLVGLAVLYGDNAVNGYSPHTVGYELTNLRVVVGRDSGNLLNLVIIVLYLLSLTLDRLYHLSDGLVDTALHIEWIGTGSHILHTLRKDGLSQNGSCGGTVASIIASLAGHTLHKLCAGILKGIFQFNLLGYGHTVLGNLGSAKLLINNNVATLGAQRNFHCISQRIGSSFEHLAGINIIFYFFSHSFLFLGVRSEEIRSKLITHCSNTSLPKVN